MKTISEPKVYLIGRQTIDDAQLSQFLSDHDVAHWQTDAEHGGDKLIEVAGRLCYMSYATPRPGGNKQYIEHILDVRHGSVTEHAVFNIVITGVSRALTHELVRHRVGVSPSQLSQRYVDESDCEFVTHPTIEGCAEAMEIWREHMAASQAAYVKLSNVLSQRLLHIDNPTARRKAAREAARGVLPNSTETKIFITANARALRHFLDIRGPLSADGEIRRLAVRLLRVLQAESNSLFLDYEVQVQDGLGEYVTNNGATKV